MPSAPLPGRQRPDPDPDRHPVAPVRNQKHEDPLADLVVVQAVGPGSQAVDLAAGAPESDRTFGLAFEGRDRIEGYLGNDPSRSAFSSGFDGLDLGQDHELAELVPRGQGEGSDGGGEGRRGEGRRQAQKSQEAHAPPCYRFRVRRALPLLLILSCAHAPGPREEGTTELDLLSFNDFHGRLYPDASGQGGAAALAAALARMRTDASLIVSAGDLVGASPLVSSHFHDEPTIQIMNEIGLDILGVGNHEFDEGLRELLRLQRGGAHPSLESTNRGFSGSQFRYLSTNTLDADGELVFDPYHIVEVDGVQVAFLSATLEGTKDIVPPVLGDVHFLDEADAIARWVDVLKERGVEAFVVLLHEGGWQEGDANQCERLYGPVVGVVDRLPQEIDVVLAGHTHQAYLCDRDDLLLASGGAYGHWITRLKLRMSKETGDVVSVSAQNIPVFVKDGEDPQVAAIVDGYAKRVEPIAQQDVGRIAEPIRKDPVRTGESPLGSVIADAQRAATKADMAFMNLGGIRDDLGLEKRAVTYGDLFRVQPFDNRLVTKRYTGREILQILEAQWGASTEHGLFQVSETLTYCYRPDAMPGAKIDSGTVKIRGRRLEPDATYVVALNSYLAQKPPFDRGRGAVVHGKDVDALVDYVKAQTPLAPPSIGRICRQDEAARAAGPD
jgi:5'-nucleotidase